MSYRAPRPAQSCSPSRPSPALLSITTRTQLKPPVIKPKKIRVLLFVDQSYSMIWQKCAADLDGESASSDPIGKNLLRSCTPEKGADQEGYRYTVIQSWLDELKLVAENRDPDDVKVAIIPFSGGRYARPNAEDRQYLEDRFAYLSLDKAQAWLNKLVEEHQSDLQRTLKGQDWGPEFMGTTVPFTTLTLATDLVADEMNKLKNEGELDGSPFRFVYISDGVFKPIEPYLAKVKQIVGCPQSCSAEPNHPACASHNYCYPYCPRTYCETIIPRDFKLAFGDPAVNRVDLIVNELQKILDLPNQIKGGLLTMHLVKLSPERVPVEDRPSPQINIFDEVFKASNKIHRSIINSTEAPFSIVNVGQGGYSYRLDQLYAMNLNAWVDARGNVAVDSDGDGLNDQAEVRLGRNPRHPRSANVCLGSIDEGYGCRVIGCEATLDIDGDGLSHCEEKSLDTLSDEADSDGDLVLDLHEVLRGYNPNTSQIMTSAANDGISDMDHFLMGLNPYTRVSDLDKSTPVIQIFTEFLGFKKASDQPDERDVTGEYNIQIRGIPIVDTLETEEFAQLVRHTGSSTKNPLVVGAKPHGPGVNQIVILARAVADQDPSRFYWMIYRKDIAAGSGQELGLKVDFSEFEYLDLLSVKRD